MDVTVAGVEARMVLVVFSRVEPAIARLAEGDGSHPVSRRYRPDFTQGQHTLDELLGLLRS